MQPVLLAQPVRLGQLVRLDHKVSKAIQEQPDLPVLRDQLDLPDLVDLQDHKDHPVLTE